MTTKYKVKRNSKPCFSTTAIVGNLRTASSVCADLFLMCPDEVNFENDLVNLVK